MSVLGARYRVRQFALALGAGLSRQNTDGLDEQLTPAQLELFHSMSSMDQHHCLSVFRALGETGAAETSLLEAALLHDVGKTVGPVLVWHRVLAVLTKALAPQLWERIEGEPGTWAYPLYVHREHHALGAEMAREAGSSDEVVWLIAHHEDELREIKAPTKELKLLTALQAADRVN